MDKVIPHLPMDPISNALVVELKLQQLERTLPGELYTTQGRGVRSIGSCYSRVGGVGDREAFGTCVERVCNGCFVLYHWRFA